MNAIGSGVVRLAGPLGAPLEVLLKLYEDDRKEEKERKLNELLESNQTISRDVLSAVFEARSDFQVTHQVLLEMVGGMLEQMRIAGAAERERLLSAPDIGLINSNHQGVSEKAVVDELVHLFAGDTNLFLVIIRDAGFPVDGLKANEAPRTLISDFVNNCRGLPPQKLAGTFRSLHARKEGSEILATLSAMFEELVIAKPWNKP